MNLILLEPEELRTDGSAHVGGIRAAHIRHVLQSADGDRIRVGVVDGVMGRATVRREGEGYGLECQWDAERPPVPRTDLLLAMPRPKVMNRLWPVLASLGVGRIMICNAWKTRREYFDTHVLDPQHIRGALIEGLQQAKDTRLPQVSIHRQFRKWVEDEFDPSAYAAKWVAHPAGPAARSIREALAEAPREGRVLLAVGPEGGWTDFELGLLEERGFSRVTWGERVLRSDTACVVLLGLIGSMR